MKTLFSIKWTPFGNEAEHLVNMAYEHLDLRKKHLKCTEKNKRVLASILAQRTGEFAVRMPLIQEGDREAVRSVLECLTGPVLTCGSGKATYALKGEYRDCQALFTTSEKHITQGRQVPLIKTGHGTIYRDGTHDEVPFKDIKMFGYSKPSLVRVVAPHEHWHIFLGDKPAPSANWKEMVESDQPHDEHDKLMDLVVSQANMRGVAIARYGHDAFIAVNPDAVLFQLDNTILRYSGKSGQRPLTEITDIYQRQHIRWGSKL